MFCKLKDWLSVIGAKTGELDALRALLREFSPHCDVFEDGTSLCNELTALPTNGLRICARVGERVCVLSLFGRNTGSADKPLAKYVA